jgi:hypothetical protein
MTPTDRQALIADVRAALSGPLGCTSHLVHGQCIEWLAALCDAVEQARAEQKEQLRVAVSRLTREKLTRRGDGIITRLLATADTLPDGGEASIALRVAVDVIREQAEDLALAQRERESAVKMRDAWQVRHQAVEDRWKMAEAELAALKDAAEMLWVVLANVSGGD